MLGVTFLSLCWLSHAYWYAVCRNVVDILSVTFYYVLSKTFFHMLSVRLFYTISVTFYWYSDCHYVEYRFAKLHYSECRNAECRLWWMSWQPLVYHKMHFWCNAIVSTRLFVNAPFHQPLRPNLTCGLYYKHVMIVNDASSGVNKWRYILEHHFWRC
jgi:hypothetical protein